MTTQDPQFNPLDDQPKYPSPPYLPPSSSDLGIPPTSQRPSIRERGLIIWILILTVFTACSGIDQNDIYAETSRALADHSMEDGFDEWSDEDWSNEEEFVRNPVQELPIDGGTALWAVVTNQSPRAVTFHDVEVSGLPEGVDADYLSGVQTVVPGESVLVALLVEGAKALSDNQMTLVELDYLVPANVEPVFVSVVDNEDPTINSSLVDAYEALVSEQVTAHKK